MRFWQTSKRNLDLSHPLVMGILNATPDSFSDGGKFVSVNAALIRAEAMIEDGADIIDVGGESTRPGSNRVSIDDETKRVVPIIEAIAKRFEIPISIDTNKSEVAAAALDAGAEIINDISGLRFDALIADVAAATGAGVVLMHSRGEFETLHSQPPTDNIIQDVVADFRRAISIAENAGVRSEQIALDVGIGFGKTQEQNLELIAKLDRLVSEFQEYPFLIGTSRKSFIGKLLDDAPVDERLSGSLATAAIAVWNGAKIVRVHDVKETVDVIIMAVALGERRGTCIDLY
ncbi:MAG: dihydropteroate synthase [Pyrinomonadaceae bacterium]